MFFNLKNINIVAADSPLQLKFLSYWGGLLHKKTPAFFQIKLVSTNIHGACQGNL
jgi:hypothetical protein